MPRPCKIIWPRWLAAGLTHCVLETTSHGLAQHRVSVCDFDIAVVTNITHEHLDFHGGYPAYQAAKAMLFEGLTTAVRKPLQPKVAVLNRDDASYEYLSPIPADRRIDYSLAGPAKLTVRNLRFSPDSTEFDLVTAKVAFPVRTNLVGDFNVSNVLAAAGAALALVPALPMQVLQHGIASLRGNSWTDGAHRWWSVLFGGGGFCSHTQRTPACGGSWPADDPLTRPGHHSIW